MARTSIILGGLALALLAFILFFERGSLSTHEREGRKGRILEDFVRDRVTRIELQRKGVTTVLVRSEAKPDDPMDAGGWRVERPYAARADQDAVDSLIGALEWITPRRSLGAASSADVTRFGLDKPRYRVSFVAGRERRSFAIGAPSGDGAGAYLQTPDDKLAYVVGRDLVESLDHEPTYFHTKELHDGLSAYTAEKLMVRDAQGERSVEKRGDLFWLVKPEPMLGSEPAVIEVVGALDALKAARFVASAPAKLEDYGLDAPRFTLALDSREYDAKVKDKSKLAHLELRVGKPCTDHKDESFLRVDQGPVMCGTDADLAKLEKAASDLRETRLLVLEDAAIRSVEIRSGKQQLILEEQGDAAHRYRWLEGGRELRTGSVDETALGDWFKALRGLRATSFEPTPAGGAPDLRAPSITLSFGRGKDKPAYDVQIGRQGGERIAVHRANEPLVSWFAGSSVELLSASAARFRKPRVLDENESAFTKLVLTSADRGSETVTKSGDRYRLEAPALAGAGLAEPERSALDEIVRLVSKLDAVRFVADSARPEHALAQPSYTLRIEYGSEAHTLRVGSVADGGHYAQLDSDPAVFVVAMALVRQLQAPLLSRSALAVPLEELTRAELLQNSARLVIEAQPTGGFAVVGAGTIREAARAERLARAIATLRAASVTGYGKPKPEEGLDHPQLRLNLTLRGAAGAQVRELLVGKAVGAEPNALIYARRSDLAASFALSEAAVADLGKAAAPTAAD